MPVWRKYPWRASARLALGCVMLYRDVKQKLVADIVSGAVPPGGGLPSETELAKRFGVSIGTIRRAVDEMVAEHVLVRQQGRGTFVGKLDKERFMFQFFKIEGRGGGRRGGSAVRAGRGDGGPSIASVPDVAALTGRSNWS